MPARRQLRSHPVSDSSQAAESAHTNAHLFPPSSCLLAPAVPEHGNRINSLEHRVNDLTRSKSEMQGPYEHSATTDDLFKATHKTAIGIVGVGIASLATLLSVQISILSRLPN